MKIAIITALSQELKAIRSVTEAPKTGRCGLHTACRGRIAGHDVVIVESGMGFFNAGRTAETVIRTETPDLLISAGFCGGISPELQVADVVVATEIAIAENGQMEEVPVEIPPFCMSFVIREQADSRRIFGGLFVSTPAIIPKGRLQQMLSPAARYPVVEMESAAIAIIAVEHGISCAALRSVSDPLNEELVFSLDEFCDTSMRIRIPKVLKTCLRKPRIIPQLLRLARNSGRAAVTLAEAIGNLLAMLHLDEGIRSTISLRRHEK